MACTEAYREHIIYTFNAFFKVVIRYAAINAWRNRNRRRQKEISFEYLTEEKFYPLSTSDEYFTSPYEQYPVTICDQTIILINGELAATLLSLPKKNWEIIFLYFLGHYSKRIRIAAIENGHIDRAICLSPNSKKWKRKKRKMFFTHHTTFYFG